MKSNFAVVKSVYVVKSCQQNDLQQHGKLHCVGFIDGEHVLVWDLRLPVLGGHTWCVAGDYVRVGGCICVLRMRSLECVLLMWTAKGVWRALRCDELCRSDLQ